MPKGDIVLISFPFTDLVGSKLRPALVLFESELDLTSCFITSHLAWQEPNDIVISPNKVNGIKTRSLIRTNKIATIDRTLAKGLLGRLTSNEILQLNSRMRNLLDL
jgi:mRNA interferase MazF